MSCTLFPDLRSWKTLGADVIAATPAPAAAAAAVAASLARLMLLLLLLLLERGM
jgi:hypothetical protein